MKKIVKYLLGLLIFLVSINNVSALSTDTSIVYDKIEGPEIRITWQEDYARSLYTGIQGGWPNYIFSTIYYSLEGNNENYVAYCVDPQKIASNHYTIDRILGDPANPLEYRAYDAGLIEILKYSYTQINDGFTFTIDTPERTGYTATVSGNELYAASSIALRAYVLGLYGMGGGAYGNTYMQTQSSAHVTAGIRWASYRYNDTMQIFKTNACNSQSSCLQTFTNMRQSTYGWYNSAYDINFGGRVKAAGVGGLSQAFNDPIVSGEEKLSIGTSTYNLYYAAQALYNIGVDAAVDYLENGRSESSVSAKVQNTVQDGARSEDQVQEFIYAQINITDFTDEAYINNFNFVCNGCSASGITYDYMQYYNANNEWVTLTPDVDLSEVIAPDEDGYRTGTIRIRIHVTKRVLDEDSCNNASFSVTYNYYDPNKEYVAALLKDKNVTDAQRLLIIDDVSDTVFTESFGGSIGCADVVCETEISVPLCSDDENEAISTITAPEKIKKCILNNYDYAGNTYQLSESNGGVDNDYCQVFCKEDYFDVIDDGKLGGIKLNPVIEDVDCGGFFQLTAHVEGKKDCYTGGSGTDKSINRELFISDIVSAQETMINGYNLIMMADAADAASYSSGAGGYYKSGNYTGITPGTSTEEGLVSIQSSTGTYSFGSTATQDQLDSEIDQTRSEGNQMIEDGYNAYVQAIRNYNGCTAAWMTEFPFEQRLKFFYSEYQGEQEFTMYYDLIAAAENEDLYYLDAQDGTLREESEVVICTGATDDNYECQTTPYTYDGSAELNIDNMNVVSEYANDIYTNQTFVVCTANGGCQQQTQAISDATFVRKTVMKSQDYITPTVFYQIEANGRITVNSGYEGNALKLDALINSLPISTSATGGGEFRLMLEDLGEFYDTGEMGRIIDFEGDHEANSVATALGNDGITVFDGDYVCHYYSNCRPADCPNCDFVCDEDECHWVECPDCDFECVNCIFNFDELQLNFKPISTTDVNSADRNLGYNWDINTTLTALEVVRDKASATIEEIEEENETIYDKTGDDSSLDFSIRLNADVINYLKEYNDSVEDLGGYANDSLTCYDATIDGETYSNIFCYSEVIDYIVENYSDQITVNNRPTGDERNDEANNRNYWTLWDWSEPARDANGQYSVIGGPSWK